MPPLRSSLVRIVIASLAMLVGGCILLVSPESGGDHCRFEGEDSTCGSCVKLRCQESVDRACDARRDGTLANLDGCTSARDGRCAALATDTSSPEAAALASCVSAACPGACAPAPGKTTTRCVPEPFGDGRQCSCTLAAPANSFVCAEAVLKDTICCAPAGWPGAGLACSCLPLGCAPNPDGCSCFPTTYRPESEVCTGQICCATSTTCRCGTRPCSAPSGERRVDRCSIAELGCAQGQERVASCTITSP